ncbi:uncharacterized protein Nmlp_1489 [Natronomonas moolapensis 8.8.11]|uniref:Putative sensor domain-containing protein n=1 Tax=Natronomonas moolapensis (strain DSM 18674 / CECT 7526 / JCM 14361 / 8.8.11) TaxID=268739 RepID=M1XP06_NATM8|nr:sensor domain-containing protein [Natronomonas moolapensis]CCQ35691.1 uncharacterized protein Nmlp_1489 [Natronomonas moolapensis 8.8.11]
MTDNQTATRNGSDGRPLRRFAGAPFRTETYAKLLYLLLAFPLGVTYFVFLAVGLSVGVGTSLLLVGVPVVVLTVVGVAFLGAVEARLTSGLLGIEAPLPEPLRADNPDGLRRVENGLVETLLGLFTAPTTWTALALLALKSIYGVFVLVISVTAAAATASLLGAPLAYDAPDVTYTVGTHVVDTLPEALGLAVVGVIVGLGSLYLLSGLATAGGLMTAALLEFDGTRNGTE